ncbi:acetate uptake transporter [Metabacillus halosaccharovorans]|uniref:acetate uptake transporter n=1 Tax=Metabacillus halosaccharovorans TaxID=930124 RepID=UPI00203D9701|nr:acetate uptake transporter [Metabacillus halosaccharovorans]MCM3441590.1 acetate uptake transporter [Metabacillus halosaccharovorans]
MNNHQVKITTADPSAIGLFGLAMVTLVASSQKLGFTEGLSFILPWAFFLGGLAQLFACVQDAKHNNIFGTTAFGAFGLFWFGVGMSWLIQLGAFGENLAANADPKQLGVAFIGYLIFSVYMTIGAMETHKVLFFIFVFIDFLFVGLSLSTFGIMHEATHMLAAVSELIIALLSFYGSAAVVLNTHFGQVVLPVGKPFGIFKK